MFVSGFSLKKIRELKNKKIESKTVFIRIEMIFRVKTTSSKFSANGNIN